MFVIIGDLESFIEWHKIGLQKIAFAERTLYDIV